MKLENFTSRPETINFRNWKKGRSRLVNETNLLKYIPNICGEQSAKTPVDMSNG